VSGCSALPSGSDAGCRSPSAGSSSLPGWEVGGSLWGVVGCEGEEDGLHALPEAWRAVVLARNKN